MKKENITSGVLITVPAGGWLPSTIKNWTKLKVLFLGLYQERWAHYFDAGDSDPAVINFERTWCYVLNKIEPDICILVSEKIAGGDTPYASWPPKPLEFEALATPLIKSAAMHNNTKKYLTHQIEKTRMPAALRKLIKKTKPLGE